MTNSQNAANPLSFIFTGRKPSKSQTLAKAKRLENQGADFIAINWGENWIDLKKQPNGIWSGFGWIKDIDGAWIARELNNCPKKALNSAFGDPMGFLRDHLTVIHIGGAK
jgi:hypothetical protein